MQMLYHAIMKFCVLTLWQQMDLSTGETRTRRLVGSMKQFRTIHTLLPFGQPWLKLMQIWIQLTRTGIHGFKCCVHNIAGLRLLFMLINLTFSNSRIWIICSGHVEAAIKSYKQALFLRPDFPEATCNLLHTLQVFLDWKN